MNRPTEGMIIVAQGLLGENEEFLVYRWSLPSDTKAGASPEAPLQSFFKPTVAPPTTSPTTAAPVSAPQATTTATPTAPSTALMCDQCSAGPFTSALALAGHKGSAHKKRRVKKPGVEGFSSASSPASSASSPASSASSPGSSGAVPASSGAVPITTAQPSQPTSAAPTEPDFRPITLTASPEQAVLSTATTEQIEKTQEQIEKKPEQPAQGPNDSLLSTSQIQAPTATSTAPKEAVKEEIKAIEGASEGSIKFAKVCGLIAKPLQEFKLHFEVNFPKDDMNKAIEAAHCAVVDGKVVFIGG
jgi:hypothetical protein